MTIFRKRKALEKERDQQGAHQRHCQTRGFTRGTVIFEIITFERLSNSKHFKTVTVTVIKRKVIQMTFKMVIGNQWKCRGDCGRQDGNGNGN